jgi:ABC-type transporter Mla MlaB component
MGSSKSVMSHDPLAGHAEATEGGLLSPGPGSTGEDSLVMPSSVTIAEVGDLKRRFMTGLENAKCLRVDCAALDVIDGAGLQLLAAVARTASERQVEVRWQSPPALLEENLVLFGLGAVVSVATTPAGV